LRGRRWLRPQVDGPFVENKMSTESQKSEALAKINNIAEKLLSDESLSEAVRKKLHDIIALLRYEMDVLGDHD
jgi:hypothetical protein